MLNIFKKKKIVSSSVSLSKNDLIFRFELSQEYDEKDNLMEIKTDQIITCIDMLNETISDLELQEADEKRKIKNKAER